MMLIKQEYPCRYAVSNRFPFLRSSGSFGGQFSSQRKNNLLWYIFRQGISKVLSAFVCEKQQRLWGLSTGLQSSLASQRISIFTRLQNITGDVTDLFLVIILAHHRQRRISSEVAIGINKRIIERCWLASSEREMAGSYFDHD